MNRNQQRLIRNINYKKKYLPYVLEAMLRDDNKCVDCGFAGYLLVHHIDESRKTGTLNNSLSNLLTLCRPCHAKKHSQTINREDVMEMRDMGMSFAEIGKALDISRQRAHQIYKIRMSRHNHFDS